MTKRSQRTRSRLTSRSTRTAVRSPSSPYPTRSGSWKRSTRRAWVRSTRRSCARSTRGKSRLWSVHGKDGELIRWLRLESRRRKSNSFRHRMAFLRDRRYSEPGGPEPPKPGARLYGGENRPDHQRLLDERRVPIRRSPRDERPRHRRHTLRGLRLPRERHTGLFGREDGEQDGVACGAKRPHHAR